MYMYIYIYIYYIYTLDSYIYSVYIQGEEGWPSRLRHYNWMYLNSFWKKFLERYLEKV